MLNWYALYTKPHCERQVNAALAADGIETFLPVLPITKRAGRPTERAFFPCYLFAHADLDVLGVNKFNRTPGMRCLVSFGNSPAPIQEHIVANIRDRLMQPQVLDARGDMLRPGDRVVITNGPFESVDAVFDKRLSPAGRVRVLIRLMQQWAALNLDANSIEKVKFPAGHGM